MIIGVPKEIKNNENRVALTPAGVSEMKKHGHTVYVQATAGLGSGFADEEYVQAGAVVLPTIDRRHCRRWRQSEMGCDRKWRRFLGSC